MSDTPGVHAQITADSTSFVVAVNNAANKLNDLTAQSKELKNAQAKLSEKLEEATKKYGEKSKKVKNLKNDLRDNAKAQKELAAEIKTTTESIEKSTQQFLKYNNDVKDNSKGTADTLKKTFGVIKGIIAGYAGKKLYEVLIGTNADYEQSLTSIEVMLQSTSKAQRMIEDIEKFAARTPLKTEDVTQATELLLSYGEAEENVMTRLQQLGDVSRGNAEKFNRVTLAYGQMVAKGKVTGEEMRQMTEAGVPLLSQLARSMNVTTAELSDMISAGKVGIPELNKALEDATSAGGQFFGMMDKQSKTFSGMMSTLSDNAAIYSRKIGEESFKYLEMEAGNLIDVLNELETSGRGDAIASQIGQDIANVVINIVNLIKWLYEMREVITTVAGAWVGFKVSMAIAGVVNNAIVGFNTLATTLKTVKTATDVAKIANDALNTSLMSSPWGVVAAIIGVVGGALLTYVTQAKLARSATEELTAEQQALTSAEVAQAEKLKLAKERLYELEDQMKSGKLTTDEATQAKKEMNTIISQLNGEIPNLKLAINSETGELNRQRIEVDNLTESYYKLMYAKAASAAYENKLTELMSKKIEAEEEKDKRQKAYNKSKKASDKATDRYFGELADDMDSGSFMGTLNNIAHDVLAPFGVQSFFTGEIYTDQDKKKLEKANKELNKINKEIEETTQKATEATLEYEKLLAEIGGGDKNENNSPSTYTPSDGSSRASGSSSGPASQKKTQAELDLDEFKKRYEDSLEYIELHNMLDDWHTIVDESGKADSEVEAYKRIVAYTSAAYNDGKIDDDYYEKTIKSLAKSLHSAQRDEYSGRFNDSLEYIEKNNKYGTWGDDNIFKAIERIQKYTDEARQNLIIDNDTYINNIAKIEELLETQISDIIEGESEKRKQTYQMEFDIEKQLIEDRLALRQAEYKKESAYLDELVKKRNQAKEDEDYATQMERLKLKLEYENDETNKNALNKEIEKLQEQIDDTEFERDIERRRENIEARQQKAEENAQKGIDLITDYYTAKMADVNIAKEITDSVDMGEYQQIGSMIGEWVATGFKLKIDSMVDSIVSSLADLPSPQTFVTNDNSKTLNISPNYQLPDNPTATDYLKATRRAFDEITFFEGY